MSDWLTNVLAVIGALWLVCAVALVMFAVACWAVGREVDAEFADDTDDDPGTPIYDRLHFEIWEREVRNG